MDAINTNDPINALHVTGCALCKYYWLAKLGGRGRGAVSHHQSILSAVARAESGRTRGARYTLIELPALVFNLGDGHDGLRGARGLVVSESQTLTPMSVHGAVSLERLDVRSVIAQFTRSPASLLALRAEGDMPVLAGPLRAWRSHSVASRKALEWRCVNRNVGADLSHLESLRMRFDQQIRQLAGEKALRA